VSLIRLIIEKGQSGTLGQFNGAYHKVNLSGINALMPPPVRPRIPIFVKENGLKKVWNRRILQVIFLGGKTVQYLDILPIRSRWVYPYLLRSSRIVLQSLYKEEGKEGKHEHYRNDACQCQLQRL